MVFEKSSCQFDIFLPLHPVLVLADKLYRKKFLKTKKKTTNKNILNIFLFFINT